MKSFMKSAVLAVELFSPVIFISIVFMLYMKGPAQSQQKAEKNVAGHSLSFDSAKHHSI